MTRLTEQERAASRRVVATVRSCGFLGGGGLSLWREADAVVWKADVEELAADLGVLGVGCVVVESWRPPLSGDPAGRVRRGREVRVAHQELPALVQRMPSLGLAVADLPRHARGFDLHALRLEGGGAMLVRLPLAADWPSWAVEQAAAVGLSCVVCGHDLRERDDGHTGGVRRRRVVGELGTVELMAHGVVPVAQRRVVDHDGGHAAVARVLAHFP